MKTYNNISILKCILLVVGFIACSGPVGAQHLTGPTNVQENTTETYTYNDGMSYTYDGWDVVGGSLLSSSESGTVYTAEVQWFSTGAGSISFKKKTTVLETLNVTISQPVTVITELNYIHNITPRKETTDVTSLSDNSKIESITYFDGLGRARQSIGIRAGGNSEDIVTHIEYDEFGRMVKEYLPYSSATDIGTYRVGALDATNAYYDTSAYEDDFPAMSVADINPYSEKEFDSSPLNRVMKQAAPGKDWKLGNGHEIEMKYLTNTSASEVRHYSVSLNKNTTNNVVTYIPSLVDNNHYPINELYKTVTRDENHDGTSSKDHTTEEFKNKQGQVVLKRTYENEVAHDTYYVYDDYGNLSFVLPPKSEAHTAKPDATELSELCYQYIYDDRNRLVEKKIPGKSWEYIVYNKLDQPVMTQDTEMKNDGKWLVTKYDVFGRVVYTAIKNTTGTRAYFQNLVNTHTTSLQFESKVTTGTGYLSTYYTNNAIPLGVDEILTINYYDDYVFDVAGGFDLPSYGVLSLAYPKGLATGSKVRILGTNDWITTVTYYDEKARPIYVYSKNDYLETVDQVKSKYSFDGIVLETTTSHDKSVGGLSLKTIDIEDRYAYDHVNRLTMHTQKINDAALGEVIASNTYDDLGQLVDKGVGGKENASRLQDIGYDYNVRGWLKSINNANGLGNDLFGFKIRYTDPIHSQGVGLYNGNIAEIDWKTQSDNTLFRYTYHYDALNRIKKADFSGGGYWARYRLDNVTYDKNGNILSLRRNGHIVAQPDRNTGSDFGTMDNLTYTYETSSNRLKKVDDATSISYGFNDGKNLPTEYTYDNNGNMISDANKDITSITYNHLNLPTNVNFVSGDISYIYDATGVKQKKIVSGTTTSYAGNFIYENDVLQMFSHPEGYVEQLSAGKVPTFGYAYQYKDHLGNIRLTYMDSDNNGSIDSSTEIIEENNYYPFGLKHKGYNDVVSANVNSVARRFMFGGKEFNDELGLDWYDISARNYDPALGRWMNLDPLAEKMRRHSPYNYAYNNPIYWIDPDGMAPLDMYIDSRTGKVLGHDGAKTNNLRVIRKQDWDYHKDEHKGTISTEATAALQADSKLVTINEEQIQNELQSVGQDSESEGNENQTYIALDVKTGEVSAHRGPDGTNTEAKISGFNKGADSATFVGDDLMLILQAHGHPKIDNEGKKNEPGTSNKDKQSAIDFEITVLSIDSYDPNDEGKYNVHSVDKEGNPKNYIGKTKGTNKDGKSSVNIKNIIKDILKSNI
jgi:RHS repeat-associated protein